MVLVLAGFVMQPLKHSTVDIPTPAALRLVIMCYCYCVLLCGELIEASLRPLVEIISPSWRLSNLLGSF